MLHYGGQMALFTVKVTGVTLFDYLQLIQLNGKSEQITVESNQNHSGIIYLKDGRIIHATNTLNQSGKEAFNELMSWGNFHFKTTTFSNTPEHNIIDAGNLLLEAAEYLDLQNQKKKKD